MSPWKGKRCLVTGGAGFIGSHLVDRLLDLGADKVAVVDTYFIGQDKNLSSAQSRYGDRLKIYREDAGDLTAMSSILEAEKSEVVFNLATKALLYSFFNPPGAAKVNLDIAIALGELLRAGRYRRLVHLSSSEVYGTAQTVPMSEQHPLLAETSYAAGKAAADLFLASYVRMFGLDITTIRPFNNYGPRQNDGALAAIIPLTVRRIQRGEAPVVQGDGHQTRDFIYVTDTVSALLELASRDGLKGEVFNLGSGRETSILDIVNGIAKAMAYHGRIEFAPPRAADVRRHCADVGKARAVIGDFAPASLASGLEATVRWYIEGEA
jgi:UDP-glucose 4-epimerase